MFLGQEYPIFDWFIIHFTENNGMAFGMEFGGFFGKTLLTLFRIIVVIVGVYYVKSIIKPNFSNGVLIALGLIIGGAMGNIIDSYFVSGFGTSFGGSGANAARSASDDRDVAHCMNSLKKSFPLSSTTIKAGKFSISIFQIASMPSSSYSTSSTFLIQS